MAKKKKNENTNQLGLFAPKPYRAPPRPEHLRCGLCGGEDDATRGYLHVYSSVFGVVHARCLDETINTLREINPNPLTWRGIFDESGHT